MPTPSHPTDAGLRTVAVTGSSGFLGRAVVARLFDGGWRVRAIVRRPASIPGASECVEAADFASPGLFTGCAAVVNCAGRAHVMKHERRELAEAAFMAVNRDLALRLAAAAREADVRRFVQVSSVAAICSTTPPGKLVGDAEPPVPSGPYGASKLEADLGLAEMAGANFAPIALRPPAIYGPGVGAWFGLLNRAARLGVPLPLASIHNRRSFAFVHNVADAIAAAVESDLSGAFIVTDSEPVSTADLYRKLLRLHGHGGRVWPFPPGMVAGAARLTLGGRAGSLVGDAAYDGSAFAKASGWRPPFTMDEGLRMTVTGDHAQA